MDITQIETLISDLAEKRNYNSIIASETTVTGVIKAFPTAWIQLPKVLYVEGRDEGVVCHSVVVKYLDDYSAYSFDDKVKRFKEIETDIVEMMVELSSCEGVVEVGEMRITPRTMTTTKHGDIAQTLEAKIVSYF